MIAKFKIFEQTSFEIGDYVIMKPLEYNGLPQTILFNNFVTNNIGQIITFFADHRHPGSDYIGVIYENSPKELLRLGYFTPDHIRYFSGKDPIMFKSKNKEYCEVFIAANKYNI